MKAASPTEEQLIDLERVLHNELESADIGLSDKIARKPLASSWTVMSDSSASLGMCLQLDAIPDYAAVVARAFESHITAHNYTGDQIRFLRAVQEVFIVKRVGCRKPISTSRR